MGKIEFRNILEYHLYFPDDVDDLRVFIRMITAIDEEFIEHGLRKSKT